MTDLNKLSERSTLDLLVDFREDDAEPFDQQAAFAEPERPWVHPSKRSGTRAPRLRTNWAEPIESARRNWHSLINSPAIEKSWADVEVALEAAHIAADQYFGISSAQANEEAEFEHEIRDAARKGERPQILRTDWAIRKITLEVEWDSAHDAALRAASQYKSLVAKVARAAIPTLVDRAEEARAKAQAAQSKADAAVREYVGTLAAITQADAELKISGPGWHMTLESQRRIPGQALAGLDDIALLLGSANPIVNGTYILDDSESLPLHTREQINAAMGEQGFWLLLEVEGSEGWAVTQYTIESRNLYQGISPELVAQLRNKSFARR